MNSARQIFARIDMPASLTPGRRVHVRHLFPLLIALNLLIAGEATGQVIRNELLLATKTDATAARLVAEIRLNLESGETERAAMNIERLRTNFPGMMVPVEARRQMETSLLADLFSAELRKSMPGVSTLVASDQDSGFRLWRSQLVDRRDPAEFLKQGDELWRRGRLLEAKRLWRIAGLSDRQQQSTASGEATSVSALQIAVLQRQTVAALFEGRFRQAGLSMQRFQEIAPDARGRLAGEEGNLVEILQRLADSLAEAQSVEFLNQGDVLPFERLRFDLIQQHWQVALRQDSNSPTRPTCAQWGDLLLIQDQAGIRALSLQTGQSAWPAGEVDEGYLFETPIGPSSEFSVAVAGGTIANGHWYSRTGRADFRQFAEGEPDSQSRLIKLDLAAQGRLSWTKTPREFRTHQAGEKRIFSGPPLPVKDRLYLPLRTAPPDYGVQIVCVDATDGKEIWTTQVGASLRIPSDVSPLFQDQLRQQEGCVCWCIDGLAVCCVDAHTGKIYWVSGIKPLFAVSEPLYRSETLIESGRVYSTTVNGVVAMDLYTGEVLWEQLMDEPPRQLVGVNDGLLIVSAPDFTAIDLQSGQVQWRLRSSSGTRLTGGAILCGRSIICPVDGELLTLDAHTGQILQRDAYRQLTGESAMTLQLWDKSLLVQEQGRVVLFEIATQREPSFRVTASWRGSFPQWTAPLPRREDQ